MVERNTSKPKRPLRAPFRRVVRRTVREMVLVQCASTTLKPLKVHVSTIMIMIMLSETVQRAGPRPERREATTAMMRGKRRPAACGGRDYALPASRLCATHCPHRIALVCDARAHDLLSVAPSSEAPRAGARPLHARHVKRPGSHAYVCDASVMSPAAYA